MRFNSDELLRVFGKDHFEMLGKWCSVAHHCTRCDLVWTCEPRFRNDTENDTKEEPCGSDYVLRTLHHRWEMRKYAFKMFRDKSWHDSQPLIVPLEEDCVREEAEAKT